MSIDFHSIQSDIANDTTRSLRRRRFALLNFSIMKRHSNDPTTSSPTILSNDTDTNRFIPIGAIETSRSSTIFRSVPKQRSRLHFSWPKNQQQLRPSRSRRNRRNTATTTNSFCGGSNNHDSINNINNHHPHTIHPPIVQRQHPPTLTIITTTTDERDTHHQTTVQEISSRAIDPTMTTKIRPSSSSSAGTTMKNRMWTRNNDDDSRDNVELSEVVSSSSVSSTSSSNIIELLREVSTPKKQEDLSAFPTITIPVTPDFKNHHQRPTTNTTQIDESHDSNNGDLTSITSSYPHRLDCHFATVTQHQHDDDNGCCYFDRQTVRIVTPKEEEESSPLHDSSPPIKDNTMHPWYPIDRDLSMCAQSVDVDTNQHEYDDNTDLFIAPIQPNDMSSSSKIATNVTRTRATSPTALLGCHRSLLTTTTATPSSNSTTTTMMIPTILHEKQISQVISFCYNILKYNIIQL